MKLLVTGSRDWTDRAHIRAVLARLQDKGFTHVVHGAQGKYDRQGNLISGADAMADEEARALGMIPLPVPAQWNHYHRAAGPIRNRQMLNEHPDIDLVVYFHPHLSGSKGTADMVKKARAAGLPVYDSHHITQGVKP